jgi:hypothetical protein
MLFSNKWKIVQGIKRGVQIWLRMLEFPEDGTAVHAMKKVIVVVGLVQESSVVQEHIKQMLAAFRLWCHSDWGCLWQIVHTRAERGYLNARFPSTQE